MDIFDRKDLDRMMQSAPLPPGVDAETARKRMEVDDGLMDAGEEFDPQMVVNK